MITREDDVDIHALARQGWTITAIANQNFDKEPAPGTSLIQPRLRESAQMNGEVDVLGQQSFLEVWNHERLVARLSAEPFTDDDAKVLSDFGI